MISRHVLTKNKFDLIQKWKEENGGSIMKFDELSQIKGISKKTVESLRKLCQEELLGSKQNPQDIPAEQFYHENGNQTIYRDIEMKAFSSDNFVLWDERITPTDLPQSQLTSTSTSSYQVRTTNEKYGKGSDKNLKSLKLVMEPKWNPTKYSAIRSFTSIYQDAMAISCTRFSCKEGRWENGVTVETWDFHKAPTLGSKQLSQISDHISKTVDKIPTSDIYIIDDHIKIQHFRKSVTPKRIPEIIQMSQQCAILLALLQYKSSRETNDMRQQPNVFFMGYNAVGRLHDLFVGNEATSNQSIITSILHGSCIFPSSNSIQALECSNIEIGDAIKNTYFKSYPVERECLGKSMLMGLTFIQLGLLGSANK